MSDNEDSSQPTGPMVTTAIILDGSYFFLALYNKLEGQWKKRSTLEKHKNQYFDGYEFVNFFLENIKIFIRELIVSFKMQSNVNDKDRKCKIYMTKSSKTSWRNNVLGEYKQSISNKILPFKTMQI